MTNNPMFYYLNIDYLLQLFVSACGYVADKIRRCCSGKDSEGEVKGIGERKCVLANGSAGDHQGEWPDRACLFM